MSVIDVFRPTELGPPDRLYTWVDVDAYFADLEARDGWPDWLREVDSYWDQVDVGVTDSVPIGEVWDWLEHVLGPGRVNRRRRLICLDRVGGRGRRSRRALDVEVQRSAEPDEDMRAPRFVEGRVTAAASSPLPRPDAPRFANDVLVCAFHSVKGGVGRTVHCIALAQSLADDGLGVLLVDGDLEAPGITCMLQAQETPIEFSWEDMLALVHGSMDNVFAEALGFGQKYMARQRFGRVFVLPARRDHVRLAPTRILPTQLQSPDRSPYIVTETLAALAHRLGAHVVLIDLHAGVSELSAPVLLDPRVRRVFVSTVSDASVRGTRRVLDELARKAPASLATDPPPALILTQFHPEHDVERLGLAASELSQAVAHVAGLTGTGPDPSRPTLPAPEPVLSPFDPSLLSLPADWSGACVALATTGLAAVVQPLVEQLKTAKFAAGWPVRRGDGLGAH